MLSRPPLSPQILTDRRKETLATHPIEMNEILQFVCKVKRYAPEDLKMYDEWTAKLPTRVKKEEKKAEDPKKKK